MSRKFNLWISFVLLTQFVYGQNYQQQIEKYRQQYKAEFLKDEHSPLQKTDLAYLRFYKPNESYKVQAKFTELTDTIGFDMQTHSGKIKKYYVYGFVTFTLKQQFCKLYIYYSKDLAKIAGLEDYLFLPFTDATNSVSTFGGGRYLDFKIKDIQQGKLIIDFNKCYNPYCAFAEAYSCPIPPKENDLDFKIESGEKLFGKPASKKSH